MDHFGGADACRRLWELEFLVEDVNLYRDLARSEQPAAGLRMSTEDRPARSARYRHLVQPSGFADELRAALRVDGQPWAVLSLFRTRGRPAFDARERDLVGGLSGPLAEAVRAHARPVPGPPEPTAEHGPGLLVFSPAGELISVNDDALAWLEELAGLRPGGRQPRGPRPDRRGQHARAGARDRGAAGARDRAGPPALERVGALAGVPRLMPARRRRQPRRHRAHHRARHGRRDRADDRAGLRADAARAADHRARRPRLRHRGHRRPAAPVHPHRARLREGDLRQGRRLEPG